MVRILIRTPAYSCAPAKCELIHTHNFNKFMWLNFHILISIY